MDIKIKKFALVTLVIAVLSGVFFLRNGNGLYAAEGSLAGKIGSVDKNKNEVIINLETGKSLNIGDRVYLRIDGSPVILKVTFPMMTTSRCAVEKKYISLIGLIKNGMPLYRYENGIENESPENRGKTFAIKMIDLPQGLRGEFGGIVSSFSEGLAIVYGSKPSGTGEGLCYGFIDKKGELVIPDIYKYDFDFDGMYDFKEGVTQVYSKNDRFHFIDKKGNKIFSLEGYDSNGQFCDGLALVSIKTGNVVKYGYINKEGKVVIEIQYDSGENFSKGFALVTKDGKQFYVNTEGRIFEETPDVLKNARIDNFTINEQDGKKYIIDKEGKTVVEIQYDSAGEFSEGLAAVYKGGKWGYIDTTGKEVIPCQFDGSEYESVKYKFSEGLAIVNKNYKYGYIDKTGNVVIPIEYDYAGFFKEGAAFVRYRERNGFILNPFNSK